MRGYSDRINHALAFAAKHHDTQVRKGLRMPYVTHAANVALILTRYGCDEPVVVSGILHDVIEDSVRDGFSHEELDERIGRKFGQDVLAIVLAVARRKTDDDGIELSRDELHDDYLRRLSVATDDSRWVCAADQVHNAGTILADLRRTIEPTTVWNRGAADRESVLHWYRSVYDHLQASGFTAPIMDELGSMVTALEAAPIGDATGVH
jgi:(p)ppGpp synthase/HD superfamily hydrolase